MMTTIENGNNEAVLPPQPPELTRERGILAIAGTQATQAVEQPPRLRRVIQSSADFSIFHPEAVASPEV